MPLDEALPSSDATLREERAKVRLGVDVGGTFTDVVLQLADGRLLVSKVSSTPRDPGLAVQQGVVEILRRAGLAPDRLDELVHGTTVGSNTILQRIGARTGLITTRGFRDVLEIARIRTPVMFDLTWEKPEPLVPRRYRVEVNERMAADGTVVEPLDTESLEGAVSFLLAEGVESIALCFLNSYANPEHEQQAKAWIEWHHPEVALTASCDVLQEMKEYERTSTTVVNAYLLTIMRTYLDRLSHALTAEGVRAPLLVMSSSGGVMGAAQAAQKPVFVAGSGPAGGVVGSARLCAADGVSSAIVFDMGGTTAKASIVEDGSPMLTAEYEFRDGISTPSRFVKGGGYMMKVPSIDIAEVGAGGGSIAWIDEGGLLRVGPMSAGADPGPACYRLGNDRPTVTDANVVLGYYSPAGLVGGSLPIDPELARRAVQTHIAEPFGLDLHAAALGLRHVANIAMARALRAVTVERGRDPRNQALVAFGGSGPAHAVDLARLLGICRVILPTLPGVFCSVGMLASDVEHNFSRPMRGLLERISSEAFDAAVAALEVESLTTLAREGYEAVDCTLTLSADMRYQGQSSELNVPCPRGPYGPELAGALREAFTRSYETTFGYTNDEPAEIVTLRMAAAGPLSARLDFRTLAGSVEDAGVAGSSRPAIFEAATGPVETAVARRCDIDSTWRHGPLIVESYDTTVVVPPQARIRTDSFGSLLVEPVDPESWAI